jgi:hypothetical protein
MTVMFMRAAIMISRAPTLPSDLKATWLVTNVSFVCVYYLFNVSPHSTETAPIPPQSIPPEPQKAVATFPSDKVLDAQS